ncbi:indolepyruvate ferredoxin oxidoreductase family protein [Burkholderia ambifaria]|uniref:indolepyruvate ferredoxin oxidoreductase family protein n=1 Tax=Burkholderia ambifaria TaxID=152480 RepID=UPI000D0074A5|nr:indolepyruvate ferredoxin oxidoreductase family protein [Burkholderia ambifaria]
MQAAIAGLIPTPTSKDSTMTLRNVSLADKYALSEDRIFISGAQAVVRMLLMQRERDRQAGLNTGGFVSGYRGSPLGGLDHQLWKAGNALAAADIVFQPGLNEELAAAAVWGSQQAEMLGEGRRDGVFALWYGKGPGVDRAGDVFRHANLAGSSKHGGALALMGDDHLAESSSAAHASEFAFADAMIPILNPAGVQEIIEYGLLGYALSRYAGTWVAIKCVKDNIESTASVDLSTSRIDIVVPDLMLPPGGLNIRREVDALGQEERMLVHKRHAAAAFVHANRLNRIVFAGGPRGRLGIVTTGKSHLDTLQALRDLGIDDARASALGLRLFKIGCPWPLDHAHVAEFVQGLECVVVVEEKRALIETQLREQLYGTRHCVAIVGKHDEQGRVLFPPTGALDSNLIGIALGERILALFGPSETIAARLARLRDARAAQLGAKTLAARVPHFCPGCPHNSSTRLPEGSIAGGGIGCHFMAMWMDRETIGFTAMGVEGAQWIGQAPFSRRDHFFQNLGDGTYNHSGSLALRFALAAGVNITYKILFNDAVAMTGGQPVEGRLTVDAIARQVHAEGVERIAVVSDEPEKYAGVARFPGGTTVHHRAELDALQRELRDVPGVSVLIYDQTCAAEKRRRRKRGKLPDPDRRVLINELVCEGCGDCGVASNCVAIQPVETEFGRKRRIDQSSCNKDFSCVDAFCPAFVTVHGAKPKTRHGALDASEPIADLPIPDEYPLDRGWCAIVNGVGGTGVITIGAVLGMAAHLEGKGVGIIDMAGLAQKGGAVHSHLRIARTPADVDCVHVAAGQADFVLGGDLVVTGSGKVLATLRRGHTRCLVNTAETMPGDFTRSVDFSLPAESLKHAIQDAAGPDQTRFFDATAAAVALFGESIAANMLLLGMACQLGNLPVSPQAIEKAIELNGEAAAMNLAAFRWGRRAAHAPASVLDAMSNVEATRRDKPATTIHEIVERRAAFLTDYQDAAYARRYRAHVERIRTAEASAAPGSSAVTEAVARNLFRLMAIKDEYEVARLYTDGRFRRQLETEFDGYDRLEFHLAPPLFARRDAQGRPVKVRYREWITAAFGVLARLKRVRGTWLDVFGHTAERRMERALLTQYADDLDRVVELIGDGRIDAARELASMPEMIRGFGHVKAANVARATDARARLLERINQPDQAASSEAPKRVIPITVVEA